MESQKNRFEYMRVKASHRFMRVEYYVSEGKSMQVLQVEYLHRLVSMQVFELSTHIDMNSLNSSNSSNSSNRSNHLNNLSMRAVQIRRFLHSSWVCTRQPIGSLPIHVAGGQYLRAYARSKHCCLC